MTKASQPTRHDAEHAAAAHRSPLRPPPADLIRIGLSNKESAIQMNVTKSTIEFHRDNLRKKLGLKHEKKNLRAYILALDAKLMKKK